jgi:hypothetical protein
MSAGGVEVIPSAKRLIPTSLTIPLNFEPTRSGFKLNGAAKTPS